MSITRILTRDEDYATAAARNGAAAEKVSTLAEVKERLFNWDAQEGSLTAMSAAGISEVPNLKAIVRSDTGDVLGVVGKGYQVHPYSEWLADSLANIVDDSDVIVQSAGLLNNGGRAWVQITRPESTCAAGMEYKPFILAGTGVDGQTATTFRNNAIVIVCQNTYAASFASAPAVRVKHTRNSEFRLSTVREALGVMFQIEDAFAAEVEALNSVSISDSQFRGLVTEFIGPVDSDAKTTRSQSIFDRKFEELTSLWKDDERVAPWKGTGLGAMQAFSTWQQHIASVKGATRAERNADNLLSGKGDAFDARIRDLILAGA